MINFLAIESWIEFAVRWLHVITGIAWIGSSFYFIALDLGLLAHRLALVLRARRRLLGLLLRYLRRQRVRHLLPRPLPRRHVLGRGRVEQPAPEPAHRRRRRAIARRHRAAAAATAAATAVAAAAATAAAAALAAVRGAPIGSCVGAHRVHVPEVCDRPAMDVAHGRAGAAGAFCTSAGSGLLPKRGERAPPSVFQVGGSYVVSSTTAGVGAGGAPAEFMAAARAIFDLIDADASGLLDHGEIVSAVQNDQKVIEFVKNCGNQNLQDLLEPSKFERSIKTLDTSGDGLIDAFEWEAIIEKALAAKLNERAAKRAEEAIAAGLGAVGGKKKRKRGAPWTGDGVELPLLIFGDMANLNGGARGNKTQKKKVSGAGARLCAAIEDEREECGKDNEPLVLFTGNSFGASFEGTVTRGDHVVPTANAMGVYCGGVGPSDLDYGCANLERIGNACNFPLLLSNVREARSGKPLAGTQASRALSVQEVLGSSSQLHVADAAAQAAERAAERAAALEVSSADTIEPAPGPAAEATADAASAAAAGAAGASVGSAVGPMQEGPSGPLTPMCSACAPVSAV